MSSKVSSSYPTIFLAVDDLRVGGIQRLVMDEAYALSGEGYIVQIITFGSERENDSIIQVDGMTTEKLFEKSILVFNFPSKKIAKLKALRLLIINSKIKSIICHSPSASFWFRFASITCFRRIDISLWIHQVLTLSDRVQAMKRVILSATANKIFFSAVQFKLEWEANLVDKVVSKVRVKQYRAVDRLGIYLPRVLQNAGGITCDPNILHLIYASRLTPWKGMDEFIKIIERNSENHSVKLTVNLNDDLPSSREKVKPEKDHVLLCKSPNALVDLKKSVHLYPTHYGDKVKYPQSIGLNVMEFAVLGIPSLISHEIVTTYPEILDSILVRSVDWRDEKLVDYLIFTLANLTETERKVAARKIQKVCSIQNHLETLKSNSSSGEDVD
jgi:glycosyltransferase involved in cell wall biosynthesis